MTAAEITIVRKGEITFPIFIHREVDANFTLNPPTQKQCVKKKVVIPRTNLVYLIDDSLAQMSGLGVMIEDLVVKQSYNLRE